MNVEMQVKKIGTVVYTDNYYNNNQSILQGMSEKDWKELKGILRERSYDTFLDEKQEKLINEAEKIVSEKNEGKLKTFINQNKDSFFTDILSGLATSGLLAILRNFCG